MSCLSDGDIECWRERNEKISIKYLEFLKGLERQRRGDGRGGAESCFSIWSYLVCRRPLGVGGAKKKRVFYVDMRVNDDCFVHSDVI